MNGIKVAGGLAALYLISLFVLDTSTFGFAVYSVVLLLTAGVIGLKGHSDKQTAKILEDKRVENIKVKVDKRRK